METMITTITNDSFSNTTLNEQKQAPPTLPPVSTTTTVVKNKKNDKKKRNRKTTTVVKNKKNDNKKRSRKSEMCIFAGCIKRASFNCVEVYLSFSKFHRQRKCAIVAFLFYH